MLSNPFRYRTERGGPLLRDICRTRRRTEKPITDATGLTGRYASAMMTEDAKFALGF